MRISDEERWKNGTSSQRKSLLWQEGINKFGHPGGGGGIGYYYYYSEKTANYCRTVWLQVENRIRDLSNSKRYSNHLPCDHINRERTG